jgi:hypothetical protein
MAIHSLVSALWRGSAAALLCASASAQLSQAWVEKFFDPAYAKSTGSEVACLPDGDFVVAGYAATSASSTDRDFLAIRYDSQGNQLWARTYDGPLQDSDEVRAVCVDSAGNVIVAGLSRGTPTSATEFALATCKYAPDGTLLWTRRFERLGPNMNSFDQWGGLGVDAAGNVYVAGTMLAATPGATDDIVLVAYDALGQDRWVRSHDGPQAFTDLALDLAVTPTDEVRITGVSMSLAGPQDCATYAYASDGSLLWDAYEPQGSGKRVDVDSQGTTYVIGEDAPSGDLLVLAYDPAGTRLWKTLVPGQWPTFTESAVALRPGEAGDLYVTAASSKISFPPDQDVLTARLGPHGDVLWASHHGSFNISESPQDLAVDAAGNAYITGRAAGSTQVGSYSSCLTLKYSPAGSELGGAGFGEPTGPFQFPQAAASAVGLADDASFVVVTGVSLDVATTLRYDHPAPPVVYCTSRPSSLARCTPSLGGTSATASVSGSAPECDVVCAPVPGGSQAAIAIASTGGALNPPVLQTFGWLCIASGPGFFRLPADLPGGANGHCDGFYEFDVRAWLVAHAGNPSLVAGGTLDLQVWYRDPPNPGGANLSNAVALEFVP